MWLGVTGTRTGGGVVFALPEVLSTFPELVEGFEDEAALLELVPVATEPTAEAVHDPP